MHIKRFEDVIAWKKGLKLYIEIHNEFSSLNDYSFKDQLFRATLSITNNIAEGFDRHSDKELKMFLVIARGSCAEVRSMIHVAYARKLIDKSKHEEFSSKTEEISKIISGFIKKLETKD